MDCVDLAVAAFVARPDRMSDRMAQWCADSCRAVETDVSAAVGIWKRTCGAAAKAHAASVRTAAKSMAAVYESLKNMSSELDAVACRCVSAVPSDDVDAIKAALAEAKRARQVLLGLEAGVQALRRPFATLQFDRPSGRLEQWVDIPMLDACRLECVRDFGKVTRCLPRGQHSFTLHVKAGMNTEDEVETRMLPLLPEDVRVAIAGDQGAEWECAQHDDSEGVSISYTAALEPDVVTLTIYVFEVPVLNERLVSGERRRAPLCNLHFSLSYPLDCADSRQVCSTRQIETHVECNFARGQHGTIKRLHGVYEPVPKHNQRP